jgi:hypothetical protein
MHQAGRDVCSCFLEKLGRKQMLVLMDEQKISPYEDFISGLQAEAVRLKKGSSLTILQKPIMELCQQFSQGNFSQVDSYRSFLEQTLREGKYDAFFCYQDEVIDYVLMETGLIDQFPKLQLGTTYFPPTNTRSRRFNQTPIVKLLFKPSLLIESAANMLQEWVYTRSRPKDISKQTLELDMQGLSPKKSERLLKWRQK